MIQQRLSTNFQMPLRLVLISVLISWINGAITLCAAIAETSNTCTFTQPTSGELIADSGMPTKLLSSSAVGGLPTEITVTCNHPVNLTVSDPIQIAGPVFSPVSSIVTVQTSFDRSTNSRGSSPLTLPVGTTHLIVNLSVDKGSHLAPGNYRYGVKFTIVP